MPNADWVDRAEYPFTDHYFDLPMGRMHYVDQGQGPSVVMVHGTPDWSFGFRHLIKCLSPHYRCIAPDHIGFGLSDKPTGWTYRPQDHARNLTMLIEGLGLEDITLMVIDFGGPIGLSYAIEQPQNVKRIVLMNTWLWSLRGEPHFERSKVFASRLGRFAYERLAFSLRVMIPMSMGNRAALTKAVHHQYLQALPTPQARHSTWVLARELLGSSAWYDALWQRRVRLQGKPMLMVWGLKDPAFRRQELERWQAAFPDAQTVTVEEIGHFVPEELGPRLCPMVEEFLGKESS